MVLLDEPTAALGVEQQAKVAELIQTVSSNGLATLLISHNLPQVYAICHRVLVLFRGEIVANLKPSEVDIDDIVGWSVHSKSIAKRTTLMAVIAAAVALALAACGSSSSSSSSSSAAATSSTPSTSSSSGSGKKLTIALVPGLTVDPFYITMHAGAAAEAKKLGVNLIWQLRYAIVDLDTVTGPLTRAALRFTDDEESALGAPAGESLRVARYETLVAVAAANLEIGLGVVLAAPFTAERSATERWAVVARRLRPGDPEREVALLYLDAPAGIRRRRLAIRNAPRDRDKLAAPSLESSERVLIPVAIVLDGTEQDLARQLALAIEALAGGARPAERRTSERVASSC